MTTNMEANAVLKRSDKIVSRELNDNDKKILLTEKDKKSTQRATDGYMNQFKKFLEVKQHPKLEAITAADLNNILYDYYASIKPQKEEMYCVQTLKCIHAGLGRFFRKSLGVDIASDSMFVKANEMFKAMTVHSKRSGKGVKNSTPPISQIDLERIAEYFNHDHVTEPNGRKLQQNLIFYIVYFFCRRGRENLYNMTKETFKIKVQPDGTEVLIQAIDEMDKNHGPDDTNRTNDAKVFSTNGNYNFSSSQNVKNSIKHK